MSVILHLKHVRNDICVSTNQSQLICRAEEVPIASAIHWHLCPCASVVYNNVHSLITRTKLLNDRFSVNIYYGTDSK